MSSIILPGRFYSQPQGPVGIAAEFSESLVHALNGAIASPTQIYDSAQQKTLEIQAASSDLLEAASVGVGKYGKYVKTDRSTLAIDGGDIVLGSKLSEYASLDQYTIIAHVQRTAARPNGILGTGFGAVVAAGATQIQWWNDNKHYFDVANETQRVSYVDADAGDLVRAWTWDGAANRKIIYKNGVAVIEDTADPDVLSAGATTYLAMNNGIACYSFLVFNKALDKGTVQALSDNPWQIFQPRRRVLYFDAASGGITAALTGQSIPASQGTLTPSVQVALTGQEVTLSEGSVSAEVTAPLSGQEVTVSGGDVGIGGDIVRALTGQALTLSQGSVGVLAANDSGVDTHDGGGWLQPVKRRKQSKEVRNELERLFRKAEVVAEKVAEVEKPKQAVKPSETPSKTQDIGLPPIAQLQGLLMHLRLIQDEMTGQQLERLVELQQQMDFARMYNIRARAALLAA